MKSLEDTPRHPFMLVPLSRYIVLILTHSLLGRIDLVVSLFSASLCNHVLLLSPFCLLLLVPSSPSHDVIHIHVAKERGKEMCEMK